MDQNNMNGSNYETEIEVSGESEMTQEASFEEASAGPSKGFIASCVIGGVATIAGIVFAVRRHNKKKRTKAQEAAEDYFENLDNEEEAEEIEVEVVEAEKSESEKAEEKK